MATDNITEFPRTSNQPPNITLDDLVMEVNDWRANKRSRNERIPEYIWQKVFALLKKFPDSTICAALGIPKAKLNQEREERKYVKTVELVLTDEPESSPVDFCEAEEEALYKPARIPATNTLIVEFCRADGRIMKIHTTTDSFAELMKAFFGTGG
jgi:hypothetical protein